MTNSTIAANMTVDELLALWPHTIAVFRTYAEACIGCTMARFCTIVEAATENGLDPDLLLAVLRRTITKNNAQMEKKI